MTENEIAKIIYEKALVVHRTLGPGLLESAYEECLSFELIQSGLILRRQQGLPLNYQGVNLEIGYRTDILVENKVIVEIKSVEKLTDIHQAQILTYLKLSGCLLGLLLNFNVALLKDGAKRYINGNLP